jgi:radical SAM protein with 4Fe4S-binding SPASM domain
MSDEYRIDSHKMIYHPGRVASFLEADGNWDKAKDVFPIYVEISPSGICNHRCGFCAMDYIGYKPSFLTSGLMEPVFADMAANGVKSVMFAGEGEPLLNREIGKLAESCKKEGIDIAFTTNGVRLDRAMGEILIPMTSWIKVSVDAGTPATYAAVHGTSPDDFRKVVENLTWAVKFRNENRLDCAIGAQALLLPENQDEIETLAGICRDGIGLDYLVVKPYSQHLSSNTRKYENVNYSSHDELAMRLSGFSTPSFKVIVRTHTIRKHIEKKRDYETCLSTPFFWAYIMATGDVYSCSAYLGNPEFNLGNIRETSFPEIWRGEKRRANIEKMKNYGMIEACRDHCRMDEVNRYLWELKHPPKHWNFI